VNFVIFSLPRSRSFWLSKFLTYGHWTCGHDVCLNFENLEDLRKYYSQERTGSCETGAMEYYKVFRQLVPELKFVVVRRELDEVKKSLWKFGITLDDAESKLEALREISKLPNTLTIHFDKLDIPSSARALWEFVLPVPFDNQWFNYFKSRNLQINMRERVNKISVNKEKTDKLKLEAIKLLETLQ